MNTLGYLDEYVSENKYKDYKFASVMAAAIGGYFGGNSGAFIGASTVIAGGYLNEFHHE